MISSVIVPRATQSRLSVLVAKPLRGAMVLLARSRTRYLDRDLILSQYAPIFLVVRLAVWIGLLVLGFGLLIWGVGAPTLASAFRLSASSVLPLGITHARSGLETAIAFLESASGVVVVALQISYLPSLYGSFNRRESLVTLLDSSSGSPPWGPEILCRHALIDNEEHLAELYHDWEQWAADVAESHTSYSILLHFRSPEPRTSWILALLACMDAASLHLSLNPLSAPASSRPFLRMGIVCLRKLTTVTGGTYSPDPMPDAAISLQIRDFEDAVARMEAVGWETERSSAEAWPHFRGWRVNYEGMAYRLAELVEAPPGPWSGSRTGLIESSMIPLRPPHRAPSAERENLLRVTAARRAHRGTSGRGGGTSPGRHG